MGLLYLLFCWTFIPAVIGLIEAIIFMTTSEESFNAKYNSKYVTTNSNTNSVPHANSDPSRTSSKNLLFGIFITSLGFLYLTDRLALRENNKTDTSIPESINETPFKRIFVNKFDTNSTKGRSTVAGFVTKETKHNTLKKHCRTEVYDGYTQCFYYNRNINLSDISQLPLSEAIEKAASTSYFKRVSISVDGKIIDIETKKSPSR